MAMVPKTLNDLLQHTQVFHAEMAARLGRCGQDEADPRNKMLLQHLALKEQKLAATLAELERDSDWGPLQTWFYEYTDRNPIAAFNLQDIDLKNRSAATISALVADWHEQLVDLFLYLTKRAESDRTEKLARDVLAIESSHARQMSYDMARAEDM
ncbi:hypothetical protein [Gilvimarinus xylanilyticus]|uniref:Uncharacterized protein n=1 Tax=Gilvimarinus xylanilyticus TaxID=2944139 RepID=A0A9X2HZK8_9GAMM|nr:hypothetical protein [Gilvimarinus xylanilyticus]MCP8900649.1 hypothetical protein [Gilvimarinus xylanilyticus]